MEHQGINPEWESLKEYATAFWTNPITRVLLVFVCAIGVGQWLGSLI